jgi:hypothetical protein
MVEEGGDHGAQNLLIVQFVRNGMRIKIKKLN